jgi:hypothetical protein
MKYDIEKILAHAKQWNEEYNRGNGNASQLTWIVAHS